MESMIVGIGGALFVLAMLGGLSKLEAGRRARMLREVTRPGKTFDLQGELLPPEETSLGPVIYERIPRATAPTYQVETRQPRHVHNLETGFWVPLATAGATALCATIGTGLLAWAFGWPARVILIAGGLSLIAAWLWRLGVVDRLTWAAEVWTRQDLDGDGIRGNPATGFALVNPATARQNMSQGQQAADDTARRAALLAFVDRCATVGCSENAQGVDAGARPDYIRMRDALLALGLASWRNPARPKAGWQLTTTAAEAREVIVKHVI